jgi:ATP phosphoribosyltransferase
MIKVALPNKGALHDPTIDLLSSCGYRVAKSGAMLSSIDSENDVEFYFLRPGDIPLYVANGILDAGITGKDFAAEKGIAEAPVLELNFGHSQLRAAVPTDSPVQTLDEFARLRIATSLPRTVRAYFSPRELTIIELEGAVEISVQLGIAEAVVDVVDTGSTLKQAGLRIVGEPLFTSNAAIFTHPGHAEPPEMTVLRNRVDKKT